MATVGLTKTIVPSRSSYDGEGVFTAGAGEVVKLEKTGTEYIEYTVPAGETWKVSYKVRVTVS